jgi:hypothetical protein
LIAFDNIVVSKDGWQVILRYDGDGYSGKYDPDPDDPESDRPMVRLVVRNKNSEGKYQDVPNASYATYLLATDAHNKLAECAKFVLEYILKEPVKDAILMRKLQFIHLHRGKPRIDMPFEKGD